MGKCLYPLIFLSGIWAEELAADRREIKELIDSRKRISLTELLKSGIDCPLVSVIAYLKYLSEAVVPKAQHDGDNLLHEHLMRHDDRAGHS